MRHPLVFLLVAVVAAGVSAACSLGDGGVEAVGGDGGSQRLPSESLRDWVSYADELAVFEVATEEALPVPGDETVHGGYQGRAVTLRIEDVLWRRRGAPSAGDEVRVVTWGWNVDGDERRPVAEAGTPRLDVGERFVAPLVRVETDGVPEWTPIGGNSIFPLDDGRITTDGIVGGEPSPLLAAAVGLTAAELAERVAETRPYPLAVTYAALDPEARYRAVNGDPPPDP